MQLLSLPRGRSFLFQWLALALVGGVLGASPNVDGNGGNNILINTSAASAATAPVSAAKVPAPPPGHWSFQRLRDPPLPAVRNQRWVRTEIDRFVLARLEQRG